MTKRQLIDWLVEWRQRVGGSISPWNHRRILQTRTKAELQVKYARLNESQGGKPRSEEGLVGEAHDDMPIDAPLSGVKGSHVRRGNEQRICLSKLFINQSDITPRLRRKAGASFYGSPVR